MPARLRLASLAALAAIAVTAAPDASASRPLGEAFARQPAGKTSRVSSKAASKPRPRRDGLGAVYARRAAIASDTPYNSGAGRNRPGSAAARRDRFGNAEGGDHDLARDGAFRGKQIAVLQLYNNAGNFEPVFDFEAPRRALEKKGFRVHRWTAVPSVDEMAHVLRRSSQLWVISGPEGFVVPDLGVRGLDLSPGIPGLEGSLGEQHTRVIGDFFHGGRGLYLWGDNQPLYREANQLGRALLGAEMAGNTLGDEIVGVQRKPGRPGLEPDHLLTTGLEHIYEGITIATIQPGEHMRPLITGSARNVVAAYYDHGGRRAILDGGFTRLYYKWDTAGTARYLKNAAAWLANSERFGTQ